VALIFLAMAAGLIVLANDHFTKTLGLSAPLPQTSVQTLAPTAKEYGLGLGAWCDRNFAQPASGLNF
jgi:hypothetical protein